MLAAYDCYWAADDADKASENRVACEGNDPRNRPKPTAYQQKSPVEFLQERQSLGFWGRLKPLLKETGIHPPPSGQKQVPSRTPSAAAGQYYEEEEDDDSNRRTPFVKPLVTMMAASMARCRPHLLDTQEVLEAATRQCRLTQVRQDSLALAKKIS